MNKILYDIVSISSINLIPKYQNKFEISFTKILSFYFELQYVY